MRKNNAGHGLWVDNDSALPSLGAIVAGKAPRMTELNAEQLQAIIDSAHEEADMELANYAERHLEGFCHVLWAVKKRILKSKYGIDWKTPAALHPGVFFD
jgi:hypothetical protein